MCNYYLIKIISQIDPAQKFESQGQGRVPIPNCVLSLKEEIKNLNNSIKIWIENFDSLKLSSEELKTNQERVESKLLEKNYLMSLYIELLKSNHNATYEEIQTKIKPYNLWNPMHIPFIFRFMTSSRSVQITNMKDKSYFKMNLNINFEIPTSHQSIVTSNKRIFIKGVKTMKRRHTNLKFYLNP